ncbi:hypothetical protein NDU88_004490 [Pleurodeles waltl]|uniref:Uncharacterized protein n=1 Tax=Pleurodeles waltl TaxID=8319 RepID=A0AAV7UFE8_PLEWA|nr:hypothetical protein NDU88_004490 [Pleurodeles waltl]
MYVAHCDGSDRSDPHTIAPSAISAWIDPEATQRAVLPIGSAQYSRDERDVKGEVPKCQGGEVGRSGNLQDAAAERTRRLERIEEERNPRSSGVPEDRTRLEPRTLAVPTQDEDRRPGKHTPRTHQASGEAWPSQDKGKSLKQKREERFVMEPVKDHVHNDLKLIE